MDEECELNKDVHKVMDGRIQKWIYIYIFRVWMGLHVWNISLFWQLFPLQLKATSSPGFIISFLCLTRKKAQIVINKSDAQTEWVQLNCISTQFLTTFLSRFILIFDRVKVYIYTWSAHPHPILEIERPICVKIQLDESW